MKTAINKQQFMKWIKVILVVTLCLGVLDSCSSYASVDVGAPFKVGPVYVNPRIGIGGRL